jgi:hypothetical protein
MSQQDPVFGSLFGWVPMPAETARIVGSLPMPTMADAPWLKDSGRGKAALLHLAVTKVAGTFPVREQTIGDCVSQGAACAVDVLQCVEIAIKGEAERWVAECATEPIYAGSRVEIGGGRIRGDGSVGAWAADWVQKFGAIPRGTYGRIDLTRYSGERAKEWGRPRGGVPDELEPTVKQHPVKAITQVRTYEEARDAIANGYPVTVASNRGFQMARDADGFARPRGNWAHQMAFIAVDDTFKRPGLLCMNSWGSNWISGPKRHDQPDGSFWVDADVATSMLRQDDSFAFAGYQGFERTDIPDFSQW